MVSHKFVVRTMQNTFRKKVQKLSLGWNPFKKFLICNIYLGPISLRY